MINLKPFILLLCFIICLFCSGGSLAEYCLAIPSIIAVSFIFFIANPKENVSILINSIIKLKEFRRLFYFFIWIIISAFVNVMFFKAHIPETILSITFTYLLAFISCFIIGFLLIYYFDTKIVIKLFVCALFAIMLFGLVEIILYKISIPLVGKVLFFTSGRATNLAYKYGLIPRIQSLFQEPSHYGWFLICNLPLTIEISKCRYRIFSNKYTNLILKKSIFPLAILSLLFVKSAINIIFGIVIIALYHLFNLSKKKLIKYFLVSVTIIFLSCIALSFIDLSNTYLYRIIKTIQAFGDFDTFALVEPSLATRITSYVNMFIIAIKHFIIGTGPGQLKYVFQPQLIHSPLPLTIELQNYYKSLFPGSPNPAIFFKVLVDTGFVGILIFISFISLIYKKIRHLSQKYSNDFIHSFNKGIFYLFITYCFLAFYDSQLTCHYFWLLFGAMSGFYYKYCWNLKRQTDG